MKITAILDDIVPIRSDIRNAVIDFSQMTISIVAVVTDVIKDGKPVIGLGFNSNGRYAQQGILRERIIPRLLAASPDSLLDEAGTLDPFKAWAVMMTNEKPGGHGERSVAVGTVDMALWDAVAKIEEKPLSQLLAERYRGGEPDSSVFVYAAGGYYYPGKDLDGLQAEIQGYLNLGYSTVKIKIGGASLDEDLRRIEAVLQMLDGGQSLAVDANGRFDLETALQYARALEPYQLKWYEEPGDPLDFQLSAALAANTSLPLATGENIFSAIDALNLLRYAGLRPPVDYIQIDPVLSYGLVEYLRVLDHLTRHGWGWRRCIPHGGHLFALHIAAGLGMGGNEAYPRVFAPFGSMGDTVQVENSQVQPPHLPGIGFEGSSEIMAHFDALLTGAKEH
jgi:L-alanine-DL-glutamate epimerase-like enolase superfamily enzyme